MNYPGRYFRTPPGAGGMGELPSTPLNDNGALAVNPPYGRPPTGNQSAPTQQGEMRLLGDNQSNWQFITFSVGSAPIKIQDFTYRKFFLIQNKSGAGTIFVGFGYSPNAGNGLVLPPGVGYEPYTYPVNEIYVASDGPLVDGLLIFGV
jgi:hypothetical protein